MGGRGPRGTETGNLRARGGVGEEEGGGRGGGGERGERGEEKG